MSETDHCIHGKWPPCNQCWTPDPAFREYGPSVHYFGLFTNNGQGQFMDRPSIKGIDYTVSDNGSVRVDPEQYWCALAEADKWPSTQSGYSYTQVRDISGIEKTAPFYWRLFENRGGIDTAIKSTRNPLKAWYWRWRYGKVGQESC